MYWREQEEKKDEYRVPDDVFDLVFKLCGSSLEIDHAYALSGALRQHLDQDTCARIGVHGVHMAVSGNGWNRPEQSDAELPLSRRSRLVIRVHRDDCEAVKGITDKTLQIGSRTLAIGASSIRKLSSMGTIHARAVRCDPEQSEDDFLQQVATELSAMDIEVSKMLCGRSGAIRAGDEVIFTRALLVADLKPEESVRIQQRGIGDGRMLGCGLFVPHKGIDAVYETQE